MKITKFIVILIAVSLLTSCAGKREINDLAIVLAVGIDKGEKQKFKVTVEVVRASDARGQTGSPAGNAGDPMWIASAEGDSIFEAIRNISTYSSRRVFWAHNYVIVVNEELAEKEGIKDIIDFFTRNPELRMRTWIVATPDKAGEVVSTQTGLEVIPGEALSKLFRYNPISAVSPRTQIRDVHTAYLSESSDPIMARVKLQERVVPNKADGGGGGGEKPPGGEEKGKGEPSIKQIEMSGTTVFKKDKMVGTLSKKETRGLLPFIENVGTAIIPLTCPGKEKEKITVEVKKNKVEVLPFIKDNAPFYKINLSLTTNVVEANCDFDIDDRKMIDEIERNLEKKYKGYIKSALEKGQKEYKADIFELGKTFENKYPEKWKSFRENWDEKYAAAKFDINVKAEVQSGVLLYTPTQPGSRGK
ncbi:MAG: Ger(x)C family spore germination protein [Bacillales bacterium]|nr:Ger(x)C family spore germination protein [Bacillales bacterium]